MTSTGMTISRRRFVVGAGAAGAAGAVGVMAPQARRSVHRGPPGAVMSWCRSSCAAAWTGRARSCRTPTAGTTTSDPPSRFRHRTAAIDWRVHFRSVPASGCIRRWCRSTTARGPTATWRWSSPPACPPTRARRGVTSTHRSTGNRGRRPRRGMDGAGSLVTWPPTASLQRSREWGAARVSSVRCAVIARRSPSVRWVRSVSKEYHWSLRRRTWWCARRVLRGRGVPASSFSWGTTPWGLSI